MSKVAIISDIHANIEALTAVLADIESAGVDRIVCLGDVVGYGPNPIECLRTIEKYDITLMGNHEYALMEGGTKFNARAKQAISWTNEVLNRTEEGCEFFEKACDLPRKKEENGCLFVHGSPCDPTNEYLLPKYSLRPKLLEPHFAKVERYCFVGHTHLPGVFEPEQKFVRPDDMLMNIFMLDENSKAIVNVGSVGQPRDKDPRSCYVIFDGDSVVYRRVEYDAEKTAEKIMKIPQLDDFLGKRLLEGK
ncbi:MAG: metallophosphoesterase family protein [Planctomycetota bacterium]|jgi:diadenosine tetraphosphatase ApaH/serine/threonine PP2A family protein phosphatase